MADRVKRSVSMPPDVDARVAAAAAAEGLTYSAWLAREADRALRLRDGLVAMQEFEAENGAFTGEELAAAQQWVDQVLAPLDGEPGAAPAAGPSRRRTPPAA